MSEMVVPEWAGDLRAKMGDMFRDAPQEAEATPVNLIPVTGFSTFFAEHTIRDKDIIVHFFPRAGESDEWAAGGYINRCKKCRRELNSEEVEKKKVCPECGSAGLVYIPSRRETKSEASFPKNMRDLIKQAVDGAWMGDVAIEPVDELGAYVVQLQGASNTSVTVGKDFMDKICEGLDALLDKSKV